jgi:hypothetical protein
MIKEIWVIVRDTNVVQGHGDSSNEMVLAYEGWDSRAIFPAFTSKKLANDYMGKLNCSGIRVQKIELRGEQ